MLRNPIVILRRNDHPNVTLRVSHLCYKLLWNDKKMIKKRSRSLRGEWRPAPLAAATNLFRGLWNLVAWPARCYPWRLVVWKRSWPSRTLLWEATDFILVFYFGLDPRHQVSCFQSCHLFWQLPAFFLVNFSFNFIACTL